MLKHHGRRQPGLEHSWEYNRAIRIRRLLGILPFYRGLKRPDVCGPLLSSVICLASPQRAHTRFLSQANLPLIDVIRAAFKAVINPLSMRMPQLVPPLLPFITPTPFPFLFPPSLVALDHLYRTSFVCDRTLPQKCFSSAIGEQLSQPSWLLFALPHGSH